MTSRFLVFDHFMRPLTELNVASTPRSWILNDVGRCEFTISINDAKFLESNIQFGNLLYIEHQPQLDVNWAQNGQLPPWVGYILPPRTWRNGMVDVVAYSAESVLAFRAMPFQKITGSPRTIFTRILELAHQNANNIVIQPGRIEDQDGHYSDELCLSAYEHMKTIARNAGMNWDVTGSLSGNGQLELFANLYERKGLDTSFVVMNQNSEMPGNAPLLTEQGNPSNVVYGYSHAVTPQTRHSGKGINQKSIDDFGPMELNVVFPGIFDKTSVLNAAQNRANDLGRPVKLLRRIVLDYGKAFSFMEVGNVVTVRDTSAGFREDGSIGLEERCKILSVDYNDLSNKCPLNLEVI